MNNISSIKNLYSELLCDDDVFMESLKDDAHKAGQGIKTDIRLWSVGKGDELDPFNLYIPKYAITAVVARTGGGKTSLMTNLAVRLTKTGASGIFVTLEEPAFHITAKMFASYSAYIGPRSGAVTTGEALKAVAGKSNPPILADFKREVLRLCRPIDANKMIDKDNVESAMLLYQPQYVADIISYVNASLPIDKPLDFVIIDFGQLMESKNADNSKSNLRIKAIMQALKQLSGTGIAVIIGGQMLREVHGVWVFDWEPEQIRDGSDFEQACSMIIAVGRDTKQKDIEQRDVVRLLKNRYGRKRVGGMMDIDFEYNFIPTLTAKPTEKSL